MKEIGISQAASGKGGSSDPWWRPHRFGARHSDVARAQDLLEVPRDSTLIASDHDEDSPALIRLEDQRLHHLALATPRARATEAAPFSIVGGNPPCA